MSKNNIWITVLIALAVGGFIWALIEKFEKEAIKEKLKQKEDDYLNLLSNYLENNKTVPTDIKNQIIHLREKYIGINDAVAIELKTIIELIEADKEVIAIEKLTKVIENLLKEKFIAEGKVKDKRTCPKLFKLLEMALEFKWITKHEFNFSLFLKDKRNEEAHELAVKLPDNWKLIAFLAGIELIYNLIGERRTN